MKVFLVTIVIIGGVFVYFYWYPKKDILRWNLKNNNASIKFNPFQNQIIKLINRKY